MTLEMLRAFFGWGALLNLLLLTFIFFVFLLGGDMIYRVHSRWFRISRETAHAILYAAMAGYKLATFLLFGVPYLVLRFFM